MSTDNSNKLSKKNLWGYALGAIPTGLMAFIFTFKYIEYFFDELQLLPIYFIIGQVIYMTVNALNDPLSGHLSDRTNADKYGSRRLIYVKYGGPIWALTFILVWFPWSYTNQVIIFIHYVISICLFDTMLSLVVLCWLAVLPEMTDDTDERGKAHFLSLIVGVICVLPFFLIIVDMNPTSVSFQILTIIMAIISTAILYLVSIMCEEKPEYRKDEALPLWKSIKEAFKSKSFVFFMGFNFCMVFIGSIGLSYLFIYLALLNKITPEGMGLFFLIYFVIAYFAQSYCLKLRPKWGIRKIILIFGTLRVVGSLFLFFFVIIPELEWMIWIAILWFSIFSGYGVFTIPMNYLSVDEDELKNGTRREGMFLGVNALITKPANSIGPILATFILVAYGYIQGADSQVESAYLGIKILWILVPAIIAGISLIFIYYYPLHGEKLEEMVKKLEELHKKKREGLK